MCCMDSAGGFRHSGCSERWQCAQWSCTAARQATLQESLDVKAQGVQRALAVRAVELHGSKVGNRSAAT